MSSDVILAEQSPDPAPIWWVNPNETDWTAWAAIISIALAIYLAMFLYAKFDTWAEHKAEGTPLAKTIPTLLTIALLYEIFPLGHVSILLPISAILVAVMADWMREQAKNQLATPELVTADPGPETSDPDVSSAAQVNVPASKTGDVEPANA